MLLIIAGYVIDMYLIHNHTLIFTHTFSGAIAIREIKSVIENVAWITGWNVKSYIKHIMKHGVKDGAMHLLNEDDKRDIDNIHQVEKNKGEH